MLVTVLVTYLVEDVVVRAGTGAGGALVRFGSLGPPNKDSSQILVLFGGGFSLVTLSALETEPRGRREVSHTLECHIL